MTAASADRNTHLREQRWRNFSSIAAAVLMYEGAMAAIDTSGNVRPARANVTDRVLGVNRRRIDNSTGSAGPVTGGVDIDPDQIATFANSAGNDAITSDHIGLSCYVVDDQTVALTDNGGTRPRAGKIHQVGTTGVQVDFRAPPVYLALSAYFLDVGAASSTYLVSPVRGIVRKILSAVHGAVAGADAVMTSAIQPAAGGGFAAITGGGWTITLAGAAAGNTNSTAPTAANLVSPGDSLRATSDGGPSNSAAATVTFLVEVASA